MLMRKPGMAPSEIRNPSLSAVLALWPCATSTVGRKVVYPADVNVKSKLALHQKK
jgi:hypothetical protein